MRWCWARRDLSPDPHREAHHVRHHAPARQTTARRAAQTRGDRQLGIATPCALTPPSSQRTSGVQLVAPRDREDRLLDPAHAVEHAVGALPGPVL